MNLYPRLFILSLFYLFVVLMAFVSYKNIVFAPDAYYYYAIAQNYVRGIGWTFDGDSITTGFHPLWMAICTAIYSISNNLTEFHAFILAILTILFIIGHYLLASVAFKTGISTTTFVFVSIPIYFVNLSIFQQLGVENTLLFVFVALFIWLNFNNEFSESKKSLYLSATLVLIYFSRTDSIILVGIYFIWLFCKDAREGNMPHFILQTMLVVGIILLHWTFMFINFGTILPTSALAIKDYLSLSASTNLMEAFSPRESIIALRTYEAFDELGFSHTNSLFLRYIGLLTPLSVVISLFVVANKKINNRWPILLIGLSSLAQMFFYALIMNGFMRPWYFTLWFIFVCYGVCYFFSDYILPRFSKINMFFPYLVMLILFVSIVYAKHLKKNYSWKTLSDASQILLDYKGKDKVLVGWTPDRAVFFSGVGIRHLEGLVNSHEYFNKYLKNGKVATYIKDVNATHYIISNSTNLPQKIPCAVKIISDADQRLSAYGIYERHNSFIAIYKILLTQHHNINYISEELCPS